MKMKSCHFCDILHLEASHSPAHTQGNNMISLLLCYFRVTCLKVATEDHGSHLDVCLPGSLPSSIASHSEANSTMHWWKMKGMEGIASIESLPSRTHSTF